MEDEATSVPPLTDISTDEPLDDIQQIKQVLAAILMVLMGQANRIEINFPIALGIKPAEMKGIRLFRQEVIPEGFNPKIIDPRGRPH